MEPTKSRQETPNNNEWPEFRGIPVGIPVIGPEFFKNRENEKGDFWLLVKCAGAIIASALFFLLMAVLIVIFGG